jgi:twitching motility protein PilT
MTNQLNLPDLLKATQEMGGSDLHLSMASPPQVRVDGHLQRLDYPDLTPDTIKALAYSVLTDVQKKKFEETWELDMAFGLRGVGRFRCNVFNQKGAVGAVFRLIPEKIRPLDELGLPPVLAELADRPRGLVLVTGPTGSGKSTTLAAMIDRINLSKKAHILTIEDPIEYLHQHKTALVNQRELHADTQSFSMALRAALREDPDVVLVGELRDLETMEAALKLAETGHLTMATLHTNSAAQTVTRIIDAFPAHQQAQIRTQLSLVLEGIVCQALLPKTGGKGRVAALEILVATPAIRNLIRDDKIHQIYGTMQTGQEKLGMQTMNQSLARLVERRMITRDSALATSSLRDELISILERSAQAQAQQAGTPGMPPRRTPAGQGVR